MLKIHNKNFGWKKVLNFTTACLTLFFSVVFFGNVFAQDITQNDIQKGLTLSPIRKELKINPGTVAEGFLSITNSTDKTVVVNLKAEEFSVINQNYDYAFTDESDVIKWVRFDKDIIELQSRQSYEINYTISVPLMTEPGGRYISLFASTESDSDSGIKSMQRVASLLYIEVIGDVSRVGKLVSLNTPWLIFDEGDWSASLQNSGTTHYVSRYKVVVKNIINNNETNSFSGDAMILPGTVKLVNDKLPSFSWPGLYKINFEVGLGDSPAITQERYVVYLPYYMAVIIVLLLITVLFITIRKNKK